ncbi:MAG: HD domain-containing protein [Ruminococcus sp.]|uniref:deoxyguanosinetriphosphate triphosphohydrolase family protein n=1 Tax=Ruminococcus sp. TaxID=41978 RepID=UPI0025DEE177|nr:HD domain-containing protein [Ruminococcus sp.]MCR5541122.1 HD domain-containing protein [Ruminococcus sp.]
MKPNLFAEVASTERNLDWKNHIERPNMLYTRKDDIRSPYERDYTRILHSLAYRRLKHKTQVFFNIDNDHICTRMEHVQHVESVSCTIANYLGLNVDLTRAIAMGHDLGHAPFGHEGEVELTKIRNENGLDNFWHERNSLRMIDKLELLEDDKGNHRNLDLTYAVRDGIISHCGEVDENGIKPRKEIIDLNEFNTSGQFQAYTWEGCVVKIADKIAYLGRDIEDAMRLNFISNHDIRKLRQIAKKYGETAVNTTVIIHDFIISICENSTPDTGIRLNDEYNEMLNEIKKYNTDYIYKNKKFNVYRKYASLIIRSIYDTLINAYDSDNKKTIRNLKKMKDFYNILIEDFLDHLSKYTSFEIDVKRDIRGYINEKIYGSLNDKLTYAQAIIDYISGMTDKYAITVFNELIRY